MFSSFSRPRRFPLFRRLWMPAVMISVGGAIIVLRFDKILEHGQEILALIFLILIAGSIHLLDIFIFKSRMPCREDMKTNDNKGANK